MPLTSERVTFNFLRGYVHSPTIIQVRNAVRDAGMEWDDFMTQAVNDRLDRLEKEIEFIKTYSPQTVVNDDDDDGGGWPEVMSESIKHSIEMLNDREGKKKK